MGNISIKDAINLVDGKKYNEDDNKIYSRIKSLMSYELGEKMSFGFIDKKYINTVFGDEFDFEMEMNGILNATKKKYSEIEECCLINKPFINKNNIHYSCGNKSLYSDSCDDFLFTKCIMDDGYINNTNCKAWLRKIAKSNNNNLVFKKTFEYCKKEENRHNIHTQLFFTYLREFGKHDIVDDVLKNYSYKTKQNEYKCAFPPFNITLKEKKEINIPRECWYKECVLSPIYKLTKNNIKNREKCHITVCDININNLNISQNDIKIICNNTFTEKKNKYKKHSV